MSKRTKKKNKQITAQDYADYFSRGFTHYLGSRKEGSVDINLNQHLSADTTDIVVNLSFNGTRHQVRLTRQA